MGLMFWRKQEDSGVARASKNSQLRDDAASNRSAGWHVSAQPDDGVVEQVDIHWYFYFNLSLVQFVDCLGDQLGVTRSWMLDRNQVVGGPISERNHRKVIVARPTRPDVSGEGMRPPPELSGAG